MECNHSRKCAYWVCFNFKFYYEFHLLFINLRFPSPKLPGFNLISYVISDAISIAIVTYAVNISIAKVYAKKHNYEIRPNQVKSKENSFLI